MALGVTLVVAVLLIMGIVSRSFRSNSSLGYNMIVGAKGGRLQLVLNTVYYLSAPIENVPYTFYQEFLDADQRGDGRDGEFARGHRVRHSALSGRLLPRFSSGRHDARDVRRFCLRRSAGRNTSLPRGGTSVSHHPEHGFFEAVLGAAVARETGSQGGRHVLAHARTRGRHHTTRSWSSGILKPSGTPEDRVAFVNMEGFYPAGRTRQAEDQQRNQIERSGRAGRRPASRPHDSRPAMSPAATIMPGSSGGSTSSPLPIAQREVTCDSAPNAPVPSCRRV